MDPAMLEITTQLPRTTTPAWIIVVAPSATPLSSLHPTYTQDLGTALVLLQSDFHDLPRGCDQGYVSINKSRLGGLQNAAVRRHHLFPWGVI